jgi:hypothetical protein
MVVRFLGTGTSTGVPEIGCRCEVCTSSDKRDHRLRASVQIDVDGKNIIIDCTRIIDSSEDLPYFQVRLRVRICLHPSIPTPFNLLFRQQAAVSPLRHHIAYCRSNGILTVSPIGISITDYP